MSPSGTPKTCNTSKESFVDRSCQASECSEQAKPPLKGVGGREPRTLKLVNLADWGGPSATQSAPAGPSRARRAFRLEALNPKPQTLNSTRSLRSIPKSSCRKDNLCIEETYLLGDDSHGAMQRQGGARAMYPSHILSVPQTTETGIAVDGIKQCLYNTLNPKPNAPGGPLAKPVLDHTQHIHLIGR